jgi:hypothetical protein
MKILQLNPGIDLLTPKGTGLAHFLLDYGQESNIIWGVILQETGEIWWFQNDEVRATKNITMKRLLNNIEHEEIGMEGTT